MSRKLAILASLLLPLVPAHAATKDGAFAVKEAGLAKCQAYVEARTARSEAVAHYLGWLAGYISAHNRHAADTLDVVPWQSMSLLAALLENYCKTNPDRSYGSAVGALVSELAPSRVRSRSESVQLTSGDKRVVVYGVIMMRAQQVLSELGHYSGPIDGKPGPSTQQAISAYQKEKNLPVTGLPDQATLFSLFR